MKSITEYSVSDKGTGLVKYKGYRAQVRHPDAVRGSDKKLEKRFSEFQFGSMKKARQAAEEWVEQTNWLRTVRQARRIVDTYTDNRQRANREFLFAIGDLSLEAVPLAEEEANTRKVGVRLRRWFDEVRPPLSYSTFQSVRYTARAWPLDTRCGDTSWSVHKVLYSRKDRFEIVKPGMKVAEAMALAQYPDEGRDIKGRVVVRGFAGAMQSMVVAEQAMRTANRKLRDIDLDEVQSEEIAGMRKRWLKEVEMNELVSEAFAQSEAAA